MRTYCVYILANKSNSVLYVGVTNDLQRRVYEHKQKMVEGFTKRYNASKLVYFEETNSVETAIVREKQLKGWLRSKKVKLIVEKNPDWEDLSENWFSKVEILAASSGDPSLRSG